MVTAAWQAKVFQIYHECLIWSISGLNGQLKGNRSQKQSRRGGGVTHEVHQNGLKWTKIDPNGHFSMEEQKRFKFVLSHLYDTISGLNAKMDTWKGLGVRTSHGGVVGSPMMFAKTDQNRPSWTKTVTIAWPSKSILNLSWIIHMTLPWTLCATPRPLYDCFWLLSLFKFPFTLFFI